MGTKKNEAMKSQNIIFPNILIEYWEYGPQHIKENTKQNNLYYPCNGAYEKKPEHRLAQV